MSFLRKLSLAALFVYCASSISLGQIDPTFIAAFQKLGSVRVVRFQPDGKILIAGSFSYAGNTAASGLFRLNTDGTLDTSFDIGKGVNSEIYDILVLADGKMLIGGYFTTFNGQPAKYLARLNSDGSLDTTFNAGGAGPSDVVFRIVQRPGGGFLIKGFFQQYNSTLRSYLAAIQSDGTLDPTFSSEAGNFFSGSCGSRTSIEIMEDGKILHADCYGPGMVRFNADGTKDDTFLFPTNIVPYSAKILPVSGGKFLVYGRYSTFEADGSVIRIAQFNSDGSKDASFTPYTANNDIYNVALTSDNKLMVTRWLGSDLILIRLLANGTVDGTFTTVNLGSGTSTPTPASYSLAINTDGSMWLGGNNLTVAAQNQSLFKLNANGTISATQVPTVLTAASIYDATLDTNGNILVLGDFTRVNNVSKRHMARITATGVLDATFVPAITNIPTSRFSPDVNAKVRVQSDGKIIVAAPGMTVSGVAGAQTIARLTPTGARDATFSSTLPNLNTYINLMEVRSDNKILVGGDFLYDGTPTGDLVLLQANGANDPGFVVNPATLNFRPYTAIILEDNTILVGGSAAAGGNLIKLSSTGAHLTDFVWNEVVNNFSLDYLTPFSITKTNEGFLVGGRVNAYSSNTPDVLVHLDPTGKPQKDFRASQQSLYITTSVLKLDNGTILYGGVAHTSTLNGLRFVNSTGKQGTLPFLPIQGVIQKILRVSATQIVVFGSFQQVDGKTAGSVFSYTLPSANTGVVSNLQGESTEPHRVQLTWEHTGHSGFEIFHSSTAESGYVKVGESSMDSFEHTFATPGTINYYKVRSFNEVGAGAFSSVVAVTTAEASLAIPTDFSLTLLPETNNVVVAKWKHANVGLHFEVQRVESLQDISNPVVSNFYNSYEYKTELNIFGQEPNRTYYYRVRAYKNSLYSAFTNFISITTGDLTIPPVHNLAATLNGRQVLLSWSDTTRTTTQFSVYRTIESNYMEFLGTVQDTTFIDTSAPDNSRISYSVIAIRTNGAFLISSDFAPLVTVYTSAINRGTWAAKASLPVARFNATAFSIGDYGYVGLGYGSTFLNDFYKFDPLANTWTPIASFPGVVRSDAFSFVINGIAYVGGGNAGSNTGLKDFYAYNPRTNTWTSLAEVPNDEAGNVGVLSSVSFAVNGRGYVTMVRRTGGVLTRELLEYNPLLNEWTKRADYPGTLDVDGISMVLEGNAFVGLGGVLSASSNWWRYVAKTNTWTKMQNSPTPRKGSASVSYLGNQYVLGGDISNSFTPTYSNTIGSYRYTYYESWSSSFALPSFTGPRSSHIAFSIGDRLYVGTGYNGAAMADIQEYTTPTPVTPGLVTDLKALYVTESETDLVWKLKNVICTEIEVELSTDGENYSPVATVLQTDTTYRLTGLQANSRYFARVRTTLPTSNGLYNTVSFFTKVKPVAPTAVILTAESATRIKVSWTDASDNETGFEIWRSEVNWSDGYYLKVGTTAANTVEFVDTFGLKQKTTYYYKLRSINEGGVSTFTEVKNRTTLGIKPSAPSQLSIRKIMYNGATVKWNYTTTEDVTGATVYYALNNTSFGGGSYFSSGDSAVISNLQSNKRYYLYVRLNNGVVLSEASDTIEFTTLEELPANPFNLTGKVLTDTSIEINWNHNPLAAEDGIIIQRALVNEGPLVFAALDTVGISIRTFLDNTTVKAERYVYKVMAFSTGGNSPAPPTVNVLSLTLPEKATQVLLSRPTLSSVKIKWNDNAFNEDGYILHQKIGGAGNIIVVDTVEANTTSFVQSNLSPDLAYTYTVISYNLAGTTPSDNAIIAVLTTPEAPGNFQASRDSLTRIKLVWSDRALNEEGFIVRTFDFTANEFITLDTLAPNTTSYLHPELFEQRVYRYQVSTFNLLGEAASPTVEVLNLILGIEEEEKKVAEIYPNPSTGYYTIKVEAPRWQMTLFTSLGEVISMTSESGFMKKLDIAHLPDGMYYITIQAGDKTMTTRIVKTAE